MNCSAYYRIAMGSLIFVMLVSLAVARPPENRYYLLKTYSLGAVEGSTEEYFDYITVDSVGRRVYLSRGTAVQVINADNGTVVGNIPGFKHQHGVAVAEEFGRGFISDSTQARVAIFDLKTLKVIGEAKADPDTDCVVYDPASKRVFAMNGDSHNTTVIDAKSGAVLKTVALGGSPEFAVADGKGMVYVNIVNMGEIAAIDTHSLTVKSRWPVAPGDHPISLAMDRQHHRLFSATRNPQMLVVMDADNGKIIQTFPISKGVDAAAYDADTGLIFASTQEGMLHVFHEDSPDKYRAIETIKTEFGAKTMALDAKTHSLFLDTADFDPTASPDHLRGVVGTFRVLVYGR